MSSDTLAKIPTAPPASERADALTVVPQRRFGQRAAVAVLVPPGFAVNSLSPVAVAVVGLTPHQGESAR
ncbi:hypothetical protein ABZ865_36920 [Streptomyces sp. NPDC047085]|uniref:hypothetical protein n=1 Tax=Streptomyces sp. NPDC047085 TaxID=3155140 RepID=UPI0033F8AACC